jgi:hypothetical protein
MNDAGVAVGEGVATTETLVGVAEGVDDDPGVGVGDAFGAGVVDPQAARAAALATTSAVREIRIEWVLSCFGVCTRNDHFFVWVTRLKRSRSRYAIGERNGSNAWMCPTQLQPAGAPRRFEATRSW